MLQVVLRRPLLLLAVGLALFPAISGAAENKVRVLIRFNRSPRAAELGAVTKHRGVVNRKFQIVPAVAATVPAAAVGRIRGEAGVAAVELDGKVTAHDINTVWGVKRIGSGPVHEGTFNAEGAAPVQGAGVRVAVMDTGIDYTHSQLGPNYFGGYDFINNDTDPWDDQYHGTHVAGTIAAVKDGVGPVGVAPAVDLYAVKVLGANGSGSWSAIIAGLDWCVNNDIQVVNLSLGGPTDPGTTVRAAFDNAYSAGLVIVASAGNSGEGADTVGYPAKYGSVIAVASTTNTDTRSSFSSTGPDVELAAPGSSIYSTYPGESYAYMNGTSMASPHVAGAAALVLSAGAADVNGDGRRNDDVRWFLQETAEDLGALGDDNYFGFGLVDAELAVMLAYDPDGGPEPAPAPIPPPTPVFDAPTNLAGAVLATQVALTWLDNSNVEEGFEIQYGIKVKNITTWYSLSTAAADATAFTSQSLADGTYQFRVRALRTTGSPQTTAWSNQIQLTIGTKGRK